MKIVALLLALGCAQYTWAHGEHPPQVAKCQKAKACTESEVLAGAESAIKLIAAKDPSKASFASVKPSKAELRDFAKGKEWVATFNSESQPEGKKSLFVFITQDGYLNGSNFTGK